MARPPRQLQLQSSVFESKSGHPKAFRAWQELEAAGGWKVKGDTWNGSGADIPAIAPPLEPIGWPVTNSGSPVVGRKGPAMPYKSVVRASMERLDRG